VQVEPVVINKQWNGKLFLSNHYLYTNLKQCHFRWEAIKTGFKESDNKVTGSGSVKSPDAGPGETVAVLIDYSNGLQEADLFRFTAIDPHGMEVYTWSWPVIQPAEKAIELLAALSSKASEISVEETEHSVKASVNGLHLSF